ncbi:group II intron reverse transcriptase/maturase, partial [Chloroflexota bacterium]
MKTLPSGDPNDPDYRRLRYLRYADDFILGFIGSKAEAETIKAQVGRYLNDLGLTLSDSKTRITHATSECARFLGYDITVTQANTKMTRHTTGYKRRVVNGRIALLVPREVVQKYKRKYSRNGKPIHNNWLTQLSDYEIVATYGAQLRGIAQYYMLATNVGKRIGEVYWYGLESLRKTLAYKHRLNKRQSYTKYRHRAEDQHERTHYRVTIAREGQPPLIAKCGEVPLRTQRPSYINNNIQEFEARWHGRSEIVTRLLRQECELFGSQGNIEAHHVNKLSNIRKKWQGRKAKPKWVEFMISRNRKTVMVCT